MLCPKCRKELPEGAVYFCPRCGSTVEPPAQAAWPQPQPQPQAQPQPEWPQPQSDWPQPQSDWPQPQPQPQSQAQPQAEWPQQQFPPEHTFRSCRQCGSLLRQDESFCPRCGASDLPTPPQPRVCPKCARTLEQDQRFCPGCGTSVDFSDPSGNSPFPQPDRKSSKKRNKKLKKVLFITIPAVVLVIAALLGVLVILPGQKRKKALEEMEAGNYIEAISLVKNQTDSEEYKAAFFESHIMFAANSFKEAMYNPDSLRINQVQFYYMPNSDDDDGSGKADEDSWDKNTIFMVAVFSGGTLGGGANNKYVVYTYDNDGKRSERKWNREGTCDSLDLDDLDSYAEKLVAAWINLLRKRADEAEIDATFDVNRMNRLLSNFASVKVDVKDLTFTAPSDTI